jgi:hypothetical protein
MLIPKNKSHSGVIIEFKNQAVKRIMSGNNTIKEVSESLRE